jgi:cellulose synthase/poly-beta-1,6-N-acetylglucosamine synthase-like glycosyltransferase
VLSGTRGRRHGHRGTQWADAMTTEIFFWGSLLLILWSYIGYLLLLKLLSVLRPRRVAKEEITPPVTLVVTAHNEATRIKQKIENCLAMDYPEDRLQIVIVSDASDDGTDEIVRSYANRGVQLYRIMERRGKHYGQGLGIKSATADIVVLSDATTFLKADAIRMMVRNFADPSIGVVSGEDVVEESPGRSSGEGAYVRYEMKLRSLESTAGSLVGASGCFFSMRRKLVEDWVDDMSSDFYMPIVAYMRGYRTVLESEAIGYYQVLGDHSREFRRKVRTVLHGLEVLFEFKEILNPFQYGFYALQMFSHKLLRWLVPFCLVAAFASNLSLVHSGLLYQVALAGQVVLYMLALIGYLIPVLQKSILLRIPLFFCMVNISIVVAWYQYISGQRQVVWTATKR